MSGQLLWSTLAIAALPAAGYPWTRLFGLRGPLALAAAWLLGAGILTTAMLVLSAAHGRFTRLSLAFIWVVVMVGGCIAARWTGQPLRPAPPTRPGRTWLPLVMITVAVIGVQTAYVWLAAVRVPLGSFDSWSLWEYKGRLFHLDGMVSGLSLHDHALIFAHPAYPPLLSLLITWIYTWVGAAAPALMKPLFPLFYCSLLAAFFAALRPRLGARVALVGTAALALVPRMADYAGTGLADVPMTAFLIAAAAGYCAYLEGGDRRALVACGVLLGFAALTKRDALPYVGAAILAQALIERRGGAVAQMATAALAVCGPWYAYVALSGVPDRDFLPATASNIGANVERIGPIARLFLLNLYAMDEWSVLWIAVPAVLLSALLSRRMRAPALLLIIVLPLAAFIGSLSLSAWPDYTEHARTSLDRLILGTCPFALWFVCEQLVPMQREVTTRAPD